MLFVSGSIMIAAHAAAPSGRLHSRVIRTGSSRDHASRMLTGRPSLLLGRMNADARGKAAILVVAELWAEKIDARAHLELIGKALKLRAMVILIPACKHQPPICRLFSNGTPCFNQIADLSTSAIARDIESSGSSAAHDAACIPEASCRSE